jgi:hypothetical protein
MSEQLLKPADVADILEVRKALAYQMLGKSSIIQMDIDSKIY